MAIAVGNRLPDVTLTVMGAEGPKPATSGELLGSGKVVLFAVPGPFTPTCSVKHLPGFIDSVDELRDKGVDHVVCMAVMDIFVLNAWAKSSGVGKQITMAADGNGDFTRSLGLEMDGTAFGMGMRSQRFAMIINDGEVDQILVDAPGEFRLSSAEYVLSQL